jgi:hypothetical protein
MPAIEVDGKCEIYGIDESVKCDSKKVKYKIQNGDYFAIVCENHVTLAEEVGWKSSFIEWRDS